MQKYDIVREERKPLSEEACPVDLMGELYKEKAENEEVIFTLTFEAFRKMCAFPSIKEITYFLPWGGTQSIGVVWLPADPTESHDDEWMVTSTDDRCKTYFVTETKTQEIVYKCPPEGSKVVHYIIE